MEIPAIIKRQYDKIKPYLQKNSIEAFRLLSNTYNFPFNVDIYGDFAVVHIFHRQPKEVFEELEDSLKQLLKIEKFFYKDRTTSPGSALKTIPQTTEVTEYGNKFFINLSDYLDVGLFLDHRETRKFIASKAKGKIILNTFAYTGSFSVYCANAGAAKTYSVDLSKTYCDWIKKNMELNHQPPENNWIYKMDTLEFFAYAKRKQLMFDIIIIDPPTFSRNKEQRFSVKKDHPALLNAALDILSPGGFILFSNNCTDFRMNNKALQPCKIQVKNDTIPPDFLTLHGQKPHHCFIITK